MADCSGFIEPLNLECFLVNALSGSMEIFIFLALIIIAISAAYFRMLNSTLLIMYAVFGVIIAQYFNGILFLVILIGGLVTGIFISRLMKR